MKRPTLRRGFTVLELIVSIPTATVLIGAMAMCVTLMMRTRSQDDLRFKGTYNLSKALNQMASDIELATSHVSSSTTHLEFLVPDRNGDELPEQIRYEWGGITGANANQILWKYNTSPLTAVFDDIGAFNVKTIHSAVTSVAPNHLRTEVAVLKAADAFPSSLYREQVVNASNPIGQYFIPDVPATGTRWDMGALRFMVRAADSNTDGILRIRVMRANSTTRLPEAPILADVQIEEWKLGSTYQWLEIPIAPIAWQTRTTPLCITIEAAGGTDDVARVQWLENGTGMPANSNLLTSTNGGATWTASNNSQSLRFYAFGFYDGYTGNRKFLTQIDLQLRSAKNSLLWLETAIRVGATPEIP